MGFYHSPRSGRPAFSLDILEMLRHPCADVFALTLVNKRILTLSDFNIQQALPAVYLKREALPLYLRHYESFMRRQRSALGNKTWRERIRDYITELARFFNQRLPAEKFPVLVWNPDADPNES
ncbi:MAG: CRISPR-associated endonuclease Cas1 [Candidatus Sumerlaeia bacterium]|nr:CRISPR-associated endonuclease Cas1 [Candidatus Sumerlaeia bacterium]